MKDSMEKQRLEESKQRTGNWQRWGPYLAERQWGTVREDYSADGNSWAYFPHDHARSRTYRWGEDGLLGICDRQARLCFAIALWNEKDPILKERLFGLTGPEGNHGEDVKECYYYLDSSPTHSFMRALYKYPQRAFPYEELTDVNHQRSRQEGEYELTDTQAFADNRYFDVQTDYAKASPDDILVRIRITNRGPRESRLHVLPTLWFRNTWTWECSDEGCTLPPRMWLADNVVQTDHETLGRYQFFADQVDQEIDATWLFTHNETNTVRHPDQPGREQYNKDAFDRFVVQGQNDAVNPQQTGSKVAAHYELTFQPGQAREIRCRLVDLGTAAAWQGEPFDEGFATTFAARQAECDEFYQQIIPQSLNRDQQQVMRQAYAGLLWTKQFYHYIVDTWLQGDPVGPAALPHRGDIRNGEWRHLFNRDILSMPDKWEYPWYAAWDSAFHMLPFARLDSHFAKEQLLLFLREWYMHPNGQIPAYEWHFSDVNPPVHAWGVWEVYQLSGPPGERDKLFLSRAFQKLIINFTWWVNRKDPRGRNIFAGGFLGLDNIGIFDRSKPLPSGFLEQADGTAWMVFYCRVMLRMALELADGNPAYGDMASKFFEHYIAIAEAMNSMDGSGLWDPEDGFYYDHLYQEGQGKGIPMRIRSLVGLIPLLSAVVLDDDEIKKLPGFKKRMDWFLKHRSPSAQHMTYLEYETDCDHTPNKRLLAIPSQDRFRRLLSVMLDENEFLSPFGIRSLSAAHRDQPFVFELGGQVEEVRYVPGESDSWMFGGNSNWRGPIWFPINYLLIESLRRYHSFYGPDYRVECPTNSGKMLNLEEVALDLERRLIKLFEQTPSGRPAHGGQSAYHQDPHWKDLILFYEYFHGDTGAGLGASHQTGWTSLVATMLEHQGRRMP